MRFDVTRGASVLLMVLIAGCGSPGPGPTGAGYTLICGPMPAETCLSQATEAVEAQRLNDPTKRVVSVTFTGSDGDMDMQFDDGTGVRIFVN